MPSPLALPNRAVVRPADQGLTWSAAVAKPTLPDPLCKGGIARWGRGRSLVEVNSDSDIVRYDTSGRVNQTVYLSKDNGDTWTKSVRVSSNSGYATVAVMERRNRSVVVDLFDEADHSLQLPCNIKVALVDPHAIDSPRAERKPDV